MNYNVNGLRPAAEVNWELYGDVKLVKYSGIQVYSMLDFPVMKMSPCYTAGLFVLCDNI